MWRDPQGRAGLGHTRLAIQDLECGIQPMSNEDGTLHLVVNGELYGFEEIGRALARRGHRLATRSDSEIVLHLYEDLDVECLRQLRGEFAFALWDERRRLLFAARDRFGIKPLYWAEHGGRFLLASEAKAILEAGVEASWNRSAYVRTLFLCQPPDATLFANIRQVPPGHYLVYDGRCTRLVKYWDLDYPTSDSLNGIKADDADLRERLRGQLDEAVRLRLKADVDVGIFLSGGIDSSAVAGMAAGAHGDPLRSFTVRFADRIFDEGDVARRTAAHIGSRHTEIDVTLADLAEAWEDAVWHGETLAANAHGVARYLQAKAVRQAGCKAVLSGEGADEVLAGYSFSRRDWDAGALTGVRPTARVPGLDAVAAKLGFVPEWLRNAATERVALTALLTPELAAEANCLDPYRTIVDELDVDGQLRGRHPMIQSLYLWSRSVLPGYILFCDRMEMAHAVEARLPFLDHVLFETIRDLPAGVLMSGASSKRILRDVAQDYVTAEVARRPKQPFTAPALATGDSPFKHEVRSRIRAGITDQGFFDASAVRAFLDRLDRMGAGADAPFERALMLIASTLAIQKRYGIASSKA